ncbi:MAG TPA: DUF4339 domain-containing protein [Tepidisphaeraceae bacterium]|nr:DUF4339 domain-containing protein [Tepidisphaeraceae bacterium]
MSDANWYYAKGQTRLGPINGQQLKELAGSGQLQPVDLVWQAGMPQWAPAGNVPGLFGGAVPPIAVPGYAAPLAPRADIGQDAGIRMLIPVGRSGWAIAAGYLGLFSFVVLPAPISLIVALIAIRDIRKHPEKHGMGRAIFGLVMGILGTVALAFGVVAMAIGR